MRMLEAGLLSAAAILAATGAEAADMMMDIKAPREPVYRCDLDGFVEMPGTDICFNIGGYVLVDFYASEDQWDVYNTGGAFGIVPDGHSLEDTFGMYSVGRVNFDARTATEYGTVRAFIEGEMYDNDRNTGGSFGLRHAFIQFGNWTFGKTWSTFMALDASPVYADVLTVTGDNLMRRNQIRYTQSFGSGVSVSIALEDQNFYAPVAINAAGTYATPPAPNAVVNDRNEFPDLVANIYFSGDWGTAQVSGALHQNEFREVSAAGTAPAPLAGNQTDSDLGWAAVFGLVLNTPSTGEGDYMTLLATYTDGASQYNRYNFLGSTNVVWGLCNVAVPTAGGCIVDSVTTWSLLASYTHNWSPTWASTFGAGYMNVDAPLATANAFVGPYFASDFSMDTWEVFGNVTWSPVPRMSYMLDIHYGHVDFNGAGTFAGVFNPFAANPAAADDDGALAAIFEVKRTF